jgi:hypothetical protein
MLNPFQRKTDARPKPADLDEVMVGVCQTCKTRVQVKRSEAKTLTDHCCLFGDSTAALRAEGLTAVACANLLPIPRSSLWPLGLKPCGAVVMLTVKVKEEYAG